MIRRLWRAQGWWIHRNQAFSQRKLAQTHNLNDLFTHHILRASLHFPQFKYSISQHEPSIAYSSRGTNLHLACALLCFSAATPEIILYKSTVLAVWLRPGGGRQVVCQHF
ncbi:hypothetical protein N7G274_010200 [Stereocaulon virgatum]|uniref:Uncharacterized protein n=1 Tax=Stereocaulon virgatum TaxID=373712 RepID=A0ABR4A170_9LECA